MKDKDIAEKILEDYPDVFADIVNGFLFNGNEVVKPEELEDMQLRSAYRAEQKLHDMERDVAKRWKKNGIRIACVGFENQTAPDCNGAVITIVLYFGYEQRWTAAKSLYEAVSVPDELKPFVTDTKINVFEVAWLKDEQVAKFKSDFRIVADYFVQKRKTGTYRGSRDTMRHVYEVLQLLSVMEHVDYLERAVVEKRVKGGERDMSSIFDQYIKEGEARKEAEVNERVATDMLKKKYPLDAIKDISRLSEAHIRKLAKSLGVAVL